MGDTLAERYYESWEAVCRRIDCRAGSDRDCYAVKPLDEWTPDEKAEYPAPLKQVNERASGVCRRIRSAELVGIRRVGGKLVQNRDAAWRDRRNTREMLRSDVIRAMDESA